jgi:hypothetical protein
MDPINWRLSNVHVPLDYSFRDADKPWQRTQRWISN